MSEGVRPTILLVEDERSIAEPFAGALSREGFEPIIAGTARATSRASCGGSRRCRSSC
jgi:DNA-binding response OmpR family regulator